MEKDRAVHHPISRETITLIKQIDLLTYLEHTEPDNLKQIGHHFFTRDHDSLCISENGYWHWQSQHVGGTTALQYLICVRGMPFYDAACVLRDGGISPMPDRAKHVSTPEKKPLQLPKPNANNDTAIRYLLGRGIALEVIRHCIDNHTLYESIHRTSNGDTYINAVFVGYDAAGIPRYGFWRGTFGAKRGDLNGSDKRYSFRIPAANKSRVLVMSEAAIECLSLATLALRRGEDFRDYHFVSGGGASMLAIDHYLSEHPEIEEIRLCHNNDAPGQAIMG
ncbi:DUF3991 domain-containing protein [Oscillospiraceae bacterium OttesenSCG-928-F05]|nr:DUF3991 domain-containing protein [Oscillospiraceae bacterium OttesenSCG-928-F05]